MRKALVLMMVVAAVALVGCKGKPGLVGSWQGSEPNPMTKEAMPVGATFDDKGGYTMTLGSGQFSSQLSGTYTYDDQTKKLTLSQQHMTIGGQEIKLPAPKSPAPLDVTWTGSDQVSIGMFTGKVDLKRK